jgi:aminoglycoside 6'-N-acetyltransferase I
MTPPKVNIRRLGPKDRSLLESAADDVFDDPVRADLTEEFLSDPRHHLVAALVGERIVGFASGVHYVHPDKPAELFVNEVGVAESHQRCGIATQLLDALFEEGRAVGCREAWVATDPDNVAARALYTKANGREDPTPFVLYAFSLEGERP